MKNILYAYSMGMLRNSLCSFPDLLSGEEKAKAGEYLTAFADKFYPGCEKSAKIGYLKTRNLAPFVLTNRLWRESCAKTALMSGTKQYVSFDIGCDVFSFCPPDYMKNTEIFTVGDIKSGVELWARLKTKGLVPPENCRFLYTDGDVESRPFVLRDSGHFSSAPALANLGTLPFYISKSELPGLLTNLADVLPRGSGVIFSYPDKDSHSSKASKSFAQTEEIWQFNKKVHYSYADIEYILSRRGFLVYEQLTPKEFDFFHFPFYNSAVSAPENIDFCLGVKKY